MHRGRPAPGLISCQLLETQPVSKSHKPFNTSSREVVVPDVFPVPPPPGPCAPSPPCSALGGRAVRPISGPRRLPPPGCPRPMGGSGWSREESEAGAIDFSSPFPTRWVTGAVAAVRAPSPSVSPYLLPSLPVPQFSAWYGLLAVAVPGVRHHWLVSLHHLKNR